VTTTPPDRRATSLPRTSRRSPRISPAPAPRQTSPAARIRRPVVGCASARARARWKVSSWTPGAASPATNTDTTIRDLRGLAWASIDNDDSKDLDQLTAAERLANGSVKVLVAIADVDALVPKGSAIDRHAERNTTSVYTPGTVFPMLPERLSTDLTSLGQDQERVFVVVAPAADVGGAGKLDWHGRPA